VSLFDNLVDEAVRNHPELSILRPVVEKELLHHDILREMSDSGLLSSLTFIGGTCLRACYGSERLSEYLDFTGGVDFDPRSLSDLPRALKHGLEEKYGLPVEVSAPLKETGNVDTWKVKVITRPERKDLKAQHIHIDICSVPSHDARPMMLRNPYGVEMGTSGLILQAQSREEILADKFIAFALRPNRLKNRDLWDIAWLKRQGIVLKTTLVAAKIIDQHSTIPDFLALLNSRANLIRHDPDVWEEFKKEMKRFLPSGKIAQTAVNKDFWTYLITIIADECKSITASLKI